MERQFDTELLDIKNQVLAMGGLVEKAIDKAVEGLIHRQPELLAEVLSVEDMINVAHLRVDEKCLSILARQTPLARDLRFIIAVIKINSDLERMGDQAVNISHNAREYIAEEPIGNLTEDLPNMAGIVKVMVRDALDAFVKRDEDQAKDVLERDDAVDELKNKIFRDLLKLMTEDSKIIRRCLNLILIARNLERLGDHATNIAEDVIFVSSGKDVRHGSTVR